MSLRRYIPGIALCLIVNLPQATQNVCDENYYISWIPSWANKTVSNSSTENITRNDLRCFHDCSNKIDQESYDKCCTCDNCLSWEGSEIDLFIEYVSVLGKSLVLFVSNSLEALNDNQVYKIEHTDSEMTAIPSNICDWDGDSNFRVDYQEEFEDIEKFQNNIVTINFEGNKIRNIPDLNCLRRLDSLNLRNNKITVLSNSSLSHLSNLRSIDFSGNSMQRMDPHTLTSPYLNLFNVNMSFNDMTKLDFSNAMSLYPFCTIDYQSNEITELTNEADFKLDLDETYGPGFVSITNNQISKFPDFKKLLSLDNLVQIGKLIHFGFDFRGIPLVCDCNLQAFMSLAVEIIDTIWQKYFEVRCTAPPELAGRLVQNVSLDLFTCPVLADSGCQTPECTCVDKPNEDNLVIDCSNAGLTEFPDLPHSEFSKYIFLNFSGNQIHKLPPNQVLSKISVLDMSRNDLKIIKSDEAVLLENATFVDISHNPRLLNLPQTFQYHNVCSRNMEDLQINCNCDTLWIEKWVHSKRCADSQQLFQCVMPDGAVKPALDFKEDDIMCYITENIISLITIVIGVLLLLLIFAGTVVYVFRYEIFIIYLRARQKRRNVIMPSFEYDVFLSYNDEEEEVSKWVEHTLEKNLIKKGYKVFRPNRDVPFGDERDSCIISVMAKTKNFLIVMTTKYLQEMEGMRSWTENEWKYGWNNFKTDRTKNIVLINFDHVTSFNVIHPQIKAFLRVGCTVDFKNRDRMIMEEIYTKLGRPRQKPNDMQKPNDKVPTKLIYMKSPYEQYKAIMYDKNEGLVSLDEAVKFRNRLVEPDKNVLPLKQYEVDMNTDPLITQDDIDNFENMSTTSDVLSTTSDVLSISQIHQDFDTDSRKSPTRRKTSKVHNNDKICKHRRCYACHLKDEKVSLPNNVEFNKTMEIFTVIRPFSAQSSSSSTRYPKESGTMNTNK